MNLDASVGQADQELLGAVQPGRANHSVWNKCRGCKSLDSVPAVACGVTVVVTVEVGLIAWSSEGRAFGGK